MRQMIIFSYIRNNKRADNNIIGKKLLRVVNVHPSFQGIGAKGEIIKSEFQKLADCLEPTNDGISIT